MVEISLSGSGEGPGWATAPGYSTAAFFAMPDNLGFCQLARQPREGKKAAVTSGSIYCDATLVG
jgi:hypothetical protein